VVSLKARKNPGSRHSGSTLSGRLMLALVFLAAPFLALSDFLLFKNVLFYFDFEVQWIPFHQFAHRALVTGQSELWNPYIMLGFPQHAESQLGAFYPLNLLLHHLPNQSYAVALSLYLHLVMAMVSTYFLARHCRLGIPGALQAAICFTFSGFLFAQFTNYNITLAATYLPLKLLLITLYFDRNRARYLFYFTLAAGVELLISHVNTSFITNGTSALYFVILSLMRNRQARVLVRDFGLFALCMVLAAVVAAVQILPTYEFFTQSDRSGGLSYEAATSYSHAFVHYLTAFFPMMHGALSFNYSGPGGFEEHFFYAGTIGILTALFGAAVLLRRRDNRALAALGITGVICFVLSLGANNPFVDLYRLLIHIPGFGLFRCPARWSVVPTLAVAIFSGYGLQALIDRMRAPKSGAAVALLVLPGLAAPLLVYAFAVNENGVSGWALLEKITQPLAGDISYWDSISRLMYGIFTHISPLAYFLSLLLALLIAALAARRLPAMYCAAAIIVLGLLDMLCVVRPANPKASPDMFTANPPHIEFLQRNAGIFRAVSTDDMPNSISLNSSMGAFYGVQSIKGYSALRLNNYIMLTDHLWHPDILDYVGVKYEIQPANNDTYEVRQRPGVFPRAFLLQYYRIEYDETSAFHTFASMSQPERKSSVALGSATADSLRLYAPNPPPPDPEAWPEVRPADIITYDHNRIVIEGETQGPAFLLLTDMFYPGWEARVNGESVPVLRLNGVFRGVYLRMQGPFRVEFEYRPRSFGFGALISFSTLLLLLALAWIINATRGLRKRVSI
jgi:hypothetical protein